MTDYEAKFVLVVVKFRFFPMISHLAALEHVPTTQLGHLDRPLRGFLTSQV